MDTQNLLDERGKSYGEAHLLTGLVMGLLQKPLTVMLVENPELAHDWVQMLSKLIRALHDPTKKDSYHDLIGYATLALGILAEKENNESVPHDK